MPLVAACVYFVFDDDNFTLRLVAGVVSDINAVYSVHLARLGFLFRVAQFRVVDRGKAIANPSDGMTTGKHDTAYQRRNRDAYEL